MYQRENLFREKLQQKEAERKQHYYRHIFVWLDQAKEYGYQEKDKIWKGQELLDEAKLFWEMYGLPEARQARLFLEEELNFEQRPKGTPVNPWIRAWFDYFAVARMRRQHLDEFKYFHNQEYYFPLARYLGIKIVEVKRKGPRWIDWKDWRSDSLTGSK